MDHEGAVLELRDTTIDELSRIAEMERVDGGRFVLAWALERHHREHATAGVVYKSICRGTELVGFLILVLDADGRSVEFRRIVIHEPGRGHGTTVVTMVDELCRTQLGRSRVWLDVFEDNHRAQRVYQKCGYRQFGRAAHEGRVLLLYEKVL